MSIVNYLSHLSNEELKNLKDEVLKLLNQDKSTIEENEGFRFIKKTSNVKIPFFKDLDTTSIVTIDVLKDIDEALVRINEDTILNGIITGLVQLVKIQCSLLLNLNSLKQATFFEEWTQKGFIREIEKGIKLHY
ncbi:hypothetical protein [Lysinibacillus fusiformis]|uniref:hypothetical protein n=1 Tax=Lysinibacillus fusiformis TaxID=28031 RepID=UPI00187FFF2B|nr:hypothetical protein [Lysinibacillus fusiformis]MBD8524047.1 hypothetical protein [Lysinibacillus fusiformis]